MDNQNEGINPLTGNPVFLAIIISILDSLTVILLFTAWQSDFRLALTALLILAGAVNLYLIGKIIRIAKEKFHNGSKTENLQE